MGMGAPAVGLLGNRFPTLETVGWVTGNHRLGHWKLLVGLLETEFASLGTFNGSKMTDAESEEMKPNG